MSAVLNVVEIKAFVPAKDFTLSCTFYQDLGFTMASNEDGVAYFKHGNCSFLLQRFYVQSHAENFMMHLLVDDANAWWARVQEQRLADRYAVGTTPPAERPWGMVDFTLTDPSGVLWRIAHNIPRRG